MGNVVIKMSVQRMVCTGCGSEANATCNCGLPYKPKADRAVEIKRAHPDKSLQTIADEIGGTKQGVSKALRAAGVNQLTPVTGKDGKTYTISPRDEEDDPLDGEIVYTPREAQRMAKDAFVLRAFEATKYAFFPPELKIDQEVIREAEAARDAWGNLVAHLKRSLQ